MRSGDKLSDRILHSPELNETLEFFYNAFIVLSSCRVNGMSVGPIPFTAILQYAQFYECDKELTEDLIELVTGLDNWYLNYLREKEK